MRAAQVCQRRGGAVLIPFCNIALVVSAVPVVCVQRYRPSSPPLRSVSGSCLVLSACKSRYVVFPDKPLPSNALLHSLREAVRWPTLTVQRNLGHETRHRDCAQQESAKTIKNAEDSKRAHRNTCCRPGPKPAPSELWTMPFPESHASRAEPTDPAARGACYAQCYVWVQPTTAGKNQQAPVTRDWGSSSSSSSLLVMPLLPWRPFPCTTCHQAPPLHRIPFTSSPSPHLLLPPPTQTAPPHLQRTTQPTTRPQTHKARRTCLNGQLLVLGEPLVHPSSTRGGGGGRVVRYERTHVLRRFGVSHAFFFGDWGALARPRGSVARASQTGP